MSQVIFVRSLKLSLSIRLPFDRLDLSSPSLDCSFRAVVPFFFSAVLFFLPCSLDKESILGGIAKRQKLL